MNNKTLLIFALVLIGIGLVGKSNLLQTFNNNACVIQEQLSVDPPEDQQAVNICKKIIESFRSVNDSSRKKDALSLSIMYYDLATLISLKSNDEIVTTTGCIKEANSLTGKMLNLNIKDKYPNLSENCEEVVTYYIGSDNINLDEALREKACRAFMALSWACQEGSK